MGNVYARAAKEVDREITKSLQQEKYSLKKNLRYHWILLGNSNSGKKTFLKQLVINFGAGFSAEHKQIYREFILKFILSILRNFLASCTLPTELYNATVEITFFVENVLLAPVQLQQLQQQQREQAAVEERYFAGVQLSNSLLFPYDEATLEARPASSLQPISEETCSTFLQHPLFHAFLESLADTENARYFFKHLRQVLSPMYIPSNVDILMIRGYEPVDSTNSTGSSNQRSKRAEIQLPASPSLSAPINIKFPKSPSSPPQSPECGSPISLVSTGQSTASLKPSRGFHELQISYHGVELHVWDVSPQQRTQLKKWIHHFRNEKMFVLFFLSLQPFHDILQKNGGAPGTPSPLAAPLKETLAQVKEISELLQVQSQNQFILVFTKHDLIKNSSKHRREGGSFGTGNNNNNNNSRHATPPTQEEELLRSIKHELSSYSNITYFTTTLVDPDSFEHSFGSLFNKFKDFIIQYHLSECGFL